MINPHSAKPSRRLLLLVAVILLLPISVRAQEVIITDSSGQTLRVDEPFSRIISLYSAHSENLCSLGAQDQLIGISPSDDFPVDILDLPRFSYRDDPEKFIAARPDLVLVRPMIERSYPQLLDKLRQAGISVVSLQPNSMTEMFDYWRQLGMLSGHAAEAENMVDRFRHEIAARQEKLASVPSSQRPRVYFEAIHAKMKTFAADSIAAFVLEQAGGVNIASDASQVRATNIGFYGKEKLLSRSDEIDVYLAQQGRMNPITIATIEQEPGYQAIKAIREKRIFLVDEQLVSRPTLRILDGIDQIHRLLYAVAGTITKEQ